MQNQTQTKNKPVHEVRLGMIKAAIWKNDTENGGVRYSVNLQRIYKDGEEWKHTDYFGRDELLLLAKVADLAHTWICEQVPERTPGQGQGQASGEAGGGGAGHAGGGSGSGRWRPSRS